MVDSRSSITLVGDFYFGEGAELEEAVDIADLLLRKSLTVVNFEGAMASSLSRKKAVNLPMAEDVMDFLPNTVLSLANNHVLDFEQDGLGRTLHNINKAGIDWFGLESRIGAADNYHIVEHNGVRLCLAGFGWRNEECVEATANGSGVVNFTRKNIDQMLQRLVTESYDFLIVYVHFGYEHEYYPLPLHVGLCRYLVDRGVDLVYGSHTHCIQPYEAYRGKYIFYGLGNFFFSPGRERYPKESDRGVIVDLSLSKADSTIRIDQVMRIQYFRDKSTFELTKDDSYLRDDILDAQNLDVYSKNYKRLRRRKRNPRPIMKFEQTLMNEIKYYLWLAAVRVTGYLGVRQMVKKLFGWG